MDVRRLVPAAAAAVVATLLVAPPAAQAVSSPVSIDPNQIYELESDP